VLKGEQVWAVRAFSRPKSVRSHTECRIFIHFKEAMSSAYRPVVAALLFNAEYSKTQMMTIFAMFTKMPNRKAGAQVPS
jgi:hypothetical protein